MALRIRRGATGVRWSPNGRKFAVASVDGTVAVGYFEAENDWWVCRHVRKAGDQVSSVLAITWHPDSLILAIGTLDDQVLVVAAGLKGVDDDLKPQNPFGTILAQVKAGSWPHGLAFSPDGNLLAWCSTHPKRKESSHELTLPILSSA